MTSSFTKGESSGSVHLDPESVDDRDGIGEPDAVLRTLISARKSEAYLMFRRLKGYAEISPDPGRWIQATGRLRESGQISAEASFALIRPFLNPLNEDLRDEDEEATAIHAEWVPLVEAREAQGLEIGAALPREDELLDQLEARIRSLEHRYLRDIGEDALVDYLTGDREVDRFAIGEREIYGLTEWDVYMKLLTSGRLWLGGMKEVPPVLTRYLEGIEAGEEPEVVWSSVLAELPDRRSDASSRIESLPDDIAEHRAPPMNTVPPEVRILTDIVAGTPSQAFERMRDLEGQVAAMDDHAPWIRAAQMLREDGTVSKGTSWILMSEFVRVASSRLIAADPAWAAAQDEFAEWIFRPESDSDSDVDDSAPRIRGLQTLLKARSVAIRVAYLHSVGEDEWATVLEERGNAAVDELMTAGQVAFYGQDMEEFEAGHGMRNGPPRIAATVGRDRGPFSQGDRGGRGRGCGSRSAHRGNSE